MEEIVQRLRGLTPIVNEICRISGTPGASVGIIHRRQVIFKQGYGFRDVERKLPPDEHTIYYLSSLSKSFTAALIGILVDRGKMAWDTPVIQLLPTVKHWDTQVREQSTIVDWMSHRTGLAPKNLIWSQEFGHQSLRRRDAIPIITYLEKVFDFRTRWLYSNWGYALADEIITKLSGQSWGSMLKKEIFDELGMSRTITDHDPNLHNVAEAYMALSDGRPHHLPRPFMEDGKVMEGAVAVQSNVHDLLKYYSAVLDAARDQRYQGTTSTPNNPLKQVEMLLKPHIALEPDAKKKERSYGLGWIRTELPNTLGAVGLNPGLVENMPVVGNGLDQNHVCIYHQGNTNTFLTSVYTLPDSHSIVVVLTNSMANNDAADWLGELFLQTLLGVPKHAENDYLALARVSAKNSLAAWPAMKRELAAARTPNTEHKDLKQYAGKYWNKVNTYCIEVLLKDDKLHMCFQCKHEELYELDHYHYDVFNWLLTHDEDVWRGRYPISRASFYLLSFKGPEGSDGIDRLIWVNDAAVPEGETMRKENAEPQVLHTEGPA